MEFEQILKERYSVRKFTKERVEEKKLEKILQAARVAPTAGNHHPQRILVLNDEHSLEKMKQCTPCHFDAKLIFLVCYDKEQEHHNHYKDQRPYRAVDASIVLTHMMLEIVNIGLGSVWVGLFDPTLLRNLFHIPDHFEILGLMPCGYPAKDAKPGKMHAERFAMEHTVFYNSFVNEKLDV